MSLSFSGVCNIIKTTFFLSIQKCALSWHFNECLKNCSGPGDSCKTVKNHFDKEDKLRRYGIFDGSYCFYDIQWQRLTFAGMAVSMLTYNNDLMCLKQCSLVFFLNNDGHCHCITRRQFQHWRLDTHHIQITPMVLKIQNLKKKGNISS